MTACQRGMRFGAGLDDHGLRKQNSGFVPQEQQYGAGPPTSRSFTKESAALSLSVADRRCCTPGRCDLSSRACSPRTPQGGLPEKRARMALLDVQQHERRPRAGSAGAPGTAAVLGPGAG
jgi:hypothetical protein